LGSGTLDRVYGWLSANDVLWLSRTQMVVKDRDKTGRPFLRVFKAINGQMVCSWQLGDVDTALVNSFDMMTTDSTGSVWVLASGYHGWHIFTRSGLEAAPPKVFIPTTGKAPR